VAGVAAVEAWASKATAVHVPGRVDVSRVYPDEGHGSFTITAIPPQTPLLTLPVLKGRWLRDGDTNAVVLNQLVVPLQVRTAPMGSMISLTAGGRTTQWKVVGVVSDFGTPATAYVNERAFLKVDSTPGYAELLRVVTVSHDQAEVAGVLKRVDAALSSSGVSIRISLPIAQLKTGLDGHVMVLVDLLLALGVVMAIVGLLGLASALSSSVVERTREFGIMRSIGATDSMIRGVVVTEGLVIAGISVVVALVLALPFTPLLGSFIGTLAFRVPLPFEYSVPSAFLWGITAFVGSFAAASIPAYVASRLTIRESLAHL
jgi:putative ABC transport system permease protein